VTSKYQKTKQTKRAGRPTKYSPQVVERLCAALEDGLPQRSACVAAGIAVSTFAEWRSRDSTIGERIEEARERARRQAMRIIKSAALSGDWRAAAEFLKLTFPDYRNSTKIDVSATASVSPIVMTEEQRMELIERRNRLLALTRGTPDDKKSTDGGQVNPIANAQFS
jgi:hypothetical protein